MRRRGRSSSKPCMRILLKKTRSPEGRSPVSYSLPVNGPTPDPSQEGSERSCAPCLFPSREGLGVDLSFASRCERKVQPFKPALAAFTMVEIAISLGVIAIALVAILGVLPTGVRVQRDNREDTIL